MGCAYTTYVKIMYDKLSRILSWCRCTHWLQIGGSLGRNFNFSDNCVEKKEKKSK